MWEKNNFSNCLLSSKYILKQIKSLLWTSVILILITSALIEGSIVPTPSMEKTILTGDRLLINKFIFGSSTPTHIPFTDIELPYFRLPALREPVRSEILVFRFPGEINELKDDKVEFWMKRCVAVPGDTFEIKNKVIYVNGMKQPIPPFINYMLQPIKQKGKRSSKIFPNLVEWNEDNYGPLIIPKKGDKINLNTGNIEIWKTLINREMKNYSVTVEKGNVLVNGKIIKSYTIKNDYYFMVGDNRDDSYDSRHWGFLSRENIIGKPIVIFWSWDSNIPVTRPFDLFSSIRFKRIAKLVK